MPPPIPTVQVTCTARDQTGAPLAGGRFKATLDRVERYHGFLVPQDVTGIADADGVCVLNLWPNSLGNAGSTYRVRAWHGVTGMRYLDAWAAVPNAPCLLQDILIATQPPSLDMAVTAAAKAAASAAAAAQSAADAAAAAGGGGPPGSIDPSGAFLVANRFSEIAASPAAQTAAQTNLGLGNTDPLAYYILARA